MDDLSNMLENARKEPEAHAHDCTCDECDPDITSEYIEKVAMECLDLAAEKCSDPLVHKVMAMMVVSRMVDWHKSIAYRQLDDDNLESMGAWMRDAGKFQACMDILCSIAIGPDDFTCCHE